MIYRENAAPLTPASEWYYPPVCWSCACSDGCIVGLTSIQQRQGTPHALISCKTLGHLDVDVKDAEKLYLLNWSAAHCGVTKVCVRCWAVYGPKSECRVFERFVVLDVSSYIVTLPSIKAVDLACKLRQQRRKRGLWTRFVDWLNRTAYKMDGPL